MACSLAESYVHLAAKEAGSAAELAAARKVDKYTTLPACYSFQPVAVEILGPINSSAVEFLSSLGHKISSISGIPNETAYLFQRISIMIQRFNATLLHDSFVQPMDSDM